MSTKLFDLAEDFVEFEGVFAENAALQEKCVGRACTVSHLAEAIDTLVCINADDGTGTWPGLYKCRNAKIGDLEFGGA